MVAHHRTLPSIFTLPLFAQIMLLLLVIAAKPAVAANTLEVSVSKTQLYLDDTLELRVQGETEFSFSIQGLLNFNNLSIPEPELGSLTEHFDIVNQNQQYNVRSINGENKAQITWLYELSPKSTGNLKIPSLTFKDSQSTPIPITVLAGSGGSANDTPVAFIKVESDKRSVYIQEQVQLTTKLYLLYSPISGDFSDPEVPDAVVEKLGEQTKHYEMVNNQRYEVIQRKFLVFPQKSGEVTIPALTFEGRVVDRSRNKRRFAKAQSNPHQLSVKPVPASYTGSTWLPAMAVEFTDSWSASPDTLKQGESATRTIKLTVLGLLGSAIPDFEDTPAPGIRSYPEAPQRESNQVPAGVQATVTQSTALVATSAGDIELPEMRVHWWDTLNDEEKVAVIPARRLTIAPAAYASQAASPPATPLSPATQTATLEGTPDPGSLTQALPATSSDRSTYWKAWALLMTLLWLITLIALIWAFRRTPASRTSDKQHPKDEKSRMSAAEVAQAFRAGSPAATNLLLTWLSQRDACNYTNLTEVRRCYPKNDSFFDALSQYESALFGRSPSRSHSETAAKLIASNLEALKPAAVMKTGPDPIATHHRALYPAQ